MTVFVLWENHATGTIDRYGPHVFLVACVADRLGIDRFDLRRSSTINGRACSGNGTILRDLGRRSLWDAAPHLIAVLDSDKLHDLLGGDARKLVADHAYTAWSAQMEAAFRDRVGPHDMARLTIRLLDRNLETLLNVLEDEAVEKDVVQRDKALHRAASNTALIRRALAEVPTWADLVDAVVHRLDLD